jgi:hypothetical protein
MKRTTSHYFTYLRLFRTLTARYDLDAYDLEILNFIFDRTRGWDKERECIPRGHFLQGVWERREGQVICVRGAITLHEDTLWRRLRSLRDRGIVSIEEGTNGRSYKLNLEDMPKLRTPKRLQKFATAETETFGDDFAEIPPKITEKVPVVGTKVHGCGHGGSLLGAGTIEEEKKDEKEPEKERIASPKASDESRELEGARKRVEGLRARRQTRRSSLLEKTQLTHDDLKRLWVEEVAARFPDRPLPLTAKEGYALYAKQKAYLQTTRTVPFGQCIAWCLDNWASILHLHFGWMRTPPAKDLPDAWFLIGHFTKFSSLFARRVGHDWVRFTDGYKADDELSQRLAAGQSYEEAKLAMRDAKDRRHDQNRVDAARKELAALVARLERLTPEEISAARNEARAKYREAMNNSVEEW